MKVPPAARGVPAIPWRPPAAALPATEGQSPSKVRPALTGVAALALSTSESCEEPIPSASLIGRRAERPANEEERRRRDGETDTARAERAAALERAVSRDLVADMFCSHRKFRRAAG